MFPESLHVDVAVVLQPCLVGFGAKDAHEAQAGLGIVEDAHDACAAFDFLVESFEQVRALEMLVVLARQHVERPGLGDVVLGPVGELGVARLPALEPGCQIRLRLLDVTACIDPAQLLQAIVISLARQIVQGVAQEVNVARGCPYFCV